MDKLSRLQALTGEKDVVSQELNGDDGWESTPQWEYPPKAAHLYEGTDSEDDEIITSRGHKTQEIEEPNEPTHTEHYVGAMSDDALAHEVFAEFQSFQLGQLAPKHEEFCLLAAIKKYPYVFIGHANKDRVAQTFFDKDQLLNKNTWDLFYVHKNRAGPSDALILVPTKQFEQFLYNINEALDTNLTIPSGASGAFQVQFGIEGMPHPRYLGRSTSKDMADRMNLNTPPNTYRRNGEPKDITPTDRSLDAFRKKIELLQLAQKAKNKVKGERRKAERIAERQAWSHSLKRVQRYLGLRETRTAFQATLKSTYENLDPQDAATSQLAPTVFTADKLAPFVLEGDIVFVCVDVEAYERDNNKITEIGISTLDTRDIAKLVPGESGKQWMNVIRCRHFRIKEYKHLQNKDFVDGCADRFEFGESEFISLKESPSVVASCFKYPFSAPGETVPISDNFPKRNVILVGHDVQQDVNYLRKIGYDVYNLSNLVEQVDTASMWRYLTRDPNPRNLGAILAELGITGWNLHNAGNDAAYTLQAMIGIAIKAIVDKTKGREVLETEKLKRVSDTVAEAQVNALEREEEWDSNAESDGGNAVKPTDPPPRPKDTKSILAKPAVSQPWTQQKTAVFGKPGYSSQGPWRHEKKVMTPQDWTQDDAAEKGGWATSTLVEPALPQWGKDTWGTPVDTKPRVAARYTPETGHQINQSSKAYGTDNEGEESNVKVLDRPSLHVGHQHKQSDDWGIKEYEDDGIPAGYSPGHRHKPLGAVASNPGVVAQSTSGHHNSQPSRAGSSVPTNYRPTAGNPVHRLADAYRYGSLGQNFVSAGYGSDQEGDVEASMDDMKLSDDGKKGHVDAW